ncbi:hypothetical protein C0J52_10130 [Blattella germanica]|nr:hypothetical protein C0J52_10130 [Blattella germanica]
MAALPNARGWCVLEYARTDSVVAVRRAFRRQFGRPAPSETSIRRWYEQLRDRGCICHQGKGRAGRPSVNEETIERVRDSFIRSPKKSVRRASQQLQIPKSTVWKIARKRLQGELLQHCLFAHIPAHTSLEHLVKQPFYTTFIGSNLQQQCTHKKK